MDISCISSSSNRTLADFVSETASIAGLRKFDVFMLRRSDLRELWSEIPDDHPAKTHSEQELTTSSLLGVHDESLREQVCQITADWIFRQFDLACKVACLDLGSVRIVAFATYFPQLSYNVTALNLLADEWGHSEKQLIYNRKAEFALAATVRIANLLFEKGLMDFPIIEIVGGSRFDTVWLPTVGTNNLPSTHQSYLLETEVEGKMHLLLDALRRIQNICNPIQSEGEKSKPIAINKVMYAIEVEPDSVYLFDSEKKIAVLERLLENEFTDLQGVVGMNFDLAHMAILDADIPTLNRFHKLFVHGHIADHPSVHTRDRSPGTWTNLENWRSNTYAYLSILEKAFEYRQANNLPHSNAVAIELEGCSRLRWVLESIAMVNYGLTMLKTHSPQIQRFHHLSKTVEE